MHQKMFVLITNVFVGYLIIILQVCFCESTHVSVFPSLPLSVSEAYTLSLNHSNFSEKSTIPPSDIVSSCALYTEIFSNYSSAYIQCIIRFSRPLTFCTQCVDFYTNAIIAFNTLRSVRQLNKKYNYYVRLING